MIIRTSVRTTPSKGWLIDRLHVCSYYSRYCRLVDSVRGPTVYHNNGKIANARGAFELSRRWKYRHRWCTLTHMSPPSLPATEPVNHTNSFLLQGPPQSPPLVVICSTDTDVSPTMANLHPLAVGLHVVLFILGISSLLLRFYSRAFVIRRWGLDDTLAVATSVWDHFPA